ncbi:MAG: hypothetical protein K8R54_14055 [Bacteroidales bacterium]|nr:hypothetical protein [Bacteroidales bacterium]
MLTIHYSGSVEETKKRSLINELTDISNEMKWNHTVIDDEDFLGIIMNVHKDCESFAILTDSDNKLVSMIALMKELQPGDERFYVSVKTNFATTDIHITIIKLLKYLKKKYIPNLQVLDEGDYWQTEDKELLQEKFDFLLKKLDEITDALEQESVPNDKTLSVDDLAKRIEDILRRNM